MKSAYRLAGVLCVAVSACASHADLQALRRPELPPRYVALADSTTALHRSVALYEINGAPEFRLFDGNGIITTRPTRADVARMFGAWLANADMLADNIGASHYLLTVTFADLRGPDVIPFTDKHARSTVTYRLEDRRTREVVFERTYEAQMQARMPGVTPEMVRAGIAGGLIGAAVAPDIADADDPASAAAGVGGLLGAGSAEFAASHETLLWDWPVALLEGAPRVARGFGLGLVIGGAAGDGDEPVSDPAARTRGGIAGAAIGFLAAAPDGRRVEHWDDQSAPGAFDGTARRREAVRGMMRQSFDRFLFGLRDADMLRIRAAVSCAELNPDGHGAGVLTATENVVAYDCPAGMGRHSF